MMATTPLRWILLLFFAGLAAMRAFGQLAPVTTFETIEWKTVDADLIVRGHVTSVERTDTETVTFHVDETLKGRPLEDLKFGVLTYSPPPKGDGWDSTASLLVFLVESKRVAASAGQPYPRFLSRYRYTPRWGRSGSSDVTSEARFELVPGLKRGPYSASGVRLSDPDAILARVKATLAATRDAPYIADKIDIRGGFHLIVPKRGPPVTNWGDTPPARIGSAAEYDGARILASTGKGASLWDATSGRLIRKFEGTGGDVRAVALSPDGENAVVSSGAIPPSWVGSVLLWDIATGKVEGQFGRPRAAVTRVDFVAGDQGLLTTCGTYGSQGPIQQLWNVFPQEPAFVFPGDGLTVSPAKTMAASYAGSFGPSSWVAVWDAASHLQLCTLADSPTTDRLFHSVRFSPYGNRIVTTSDKGVEVWKAETGTHVMQLTDARSWFADYTPDGLQILSVMPETVDVWGAQTGKLVRHIACPARPHQIVLSPDGKRLLVTWGQGFFESNAAGATLVDLETGKDVLRIDTEVSGLIGFSPDSKTVCAIRPGEDGKPARSAVIWDAETGKVLRTVHLG